MAKLMIDLDAGAFKRALTKSGKSINWARTNCELPRRIADEVKDGNKDFIATPVDVVLKLAKGLLIEPFELVGDGAFRKLALLNAEEIGMLDLCPGDEPHMEVLAEPVSLESIRREIQLHRESWKPTISQRYSCDSDLTKAEVDWLLEYLEWFDAAPAIAWEMAVADEIVAASGTLLKRIDEEIRSIPQKASKEAGNARSMENLVSKAMTAKASRQTVNANLDYPESGFRIFGKTVVRQLTADLTIFDDYDEESRSKHVHHKFSAPVTHITHYLFVAPSQSQLVYLRVPPETGPLLLEGDMPSLNHFHFTLDDGEDYQIHDDPEGRRKFLGSLERISELALTHPTDSNSQEEEI